jgi:type II secretory pathway predicted ATPase ExeA/thioredoxin-like negative regulator of GroEL
MYLSYYNLSDWPFQINSDPRFLWLGEKHKEALSTLIYGVQDRRAFLLLTGDVGTGKTTLVNSLLEKLDESVLVGNITDPKLDLLGFLNVVTASLGLPEKSEKKEDFLSRFSRFLNEKYAEGKYVLLIIDEAHTLSADHLEQIRLLSNIELPERRLISIFLVGQDELNETLTSYECRALRQRISLICRVEPLSEVETAEYIRHRLKIAGAGRELFSKAAILEIHRFSRGYPRLINIICDHALLTGYARDSRKITPNLIKECGREMLLPGERLETVKPLSEKPEQQERPEPERSPPSGRDPGQDLTRIQAFWSRLRVKSPLYWAMWACLPVLILSLAAISRTDLFSKRDRDETALSENASPTVQDPPADRMVSALPEEAPAAEDKDPEVNATAVQASAEPADSPKAEAFTPTAPDEEEESHTPVEAMPRTEEKNLLDPVEAALGRQDFRLAIQLSEEIMAGVPSPPPGLKALYLDALLNQAESLPGGDTISSEDLLNKAIAADPENIRALLLLAKLYTGQKLYDKALETYQRATALKPDMPGLFFNMGFLYAAKGDHALAEGAFGRAIELSPPYMDQALFNLAVVQDKMGKREASLQSLRKALEVNPNNRKARELLEHITGGSGGRS